MVVGSARMDSSVSSLVHLLFFSAGGLAWVFAGALLSCIWVTIPSSLALADFFGIFYKIHRVNGSYYIGIPESGKVSKGRFVV